MKLLRLDLLLKLLLDYYSDDEIKKAKDELYNHFPQEFRPNNLRKRLRQGANKSEMNIKDMVKVFHAMHTRGGVEDTRLEAKAQDTKKSEAKAKDSLSEDRHS